MDWKKQLFPNCAYKSYLNHASLTPLNLRSFDAMNTMMGHYAKKGLDAWRDGSASRARLKIALGELMGCEPSQIGLTSNTSHGMVIIANEYPWQANDAIILFRGEFPGNVAPWLAAAERYQLRVIWLDLEDLEQETAQFKEAMASGAKLLSISWVQYQTGRTQSFAHLSKIRQTYGIHVFVDVIQGLGPLQLNLRETPVDFITCGGHKWLMSPEGTGFLYINPERISALKPLMVGWLSQEDPVSFLFRGSGLVNYEKPFRQEAGRVESATMNNTGYAGMEASIKLLLEVGPANIEKQVRHLATYARQGLNNLGLKTEDTLADAAIVCTPLDPEPLTYVHKKLDDEGIAVATPDGRLRISPHFYNSIEDIDHCLTVLGKCL